MKIVINKTGEIQEVSEKIASRLINKGKAHPAPVEIKPILKPAIVTDIDLIEPTAERFTSSEEPGKVKKSKKRSRYIGNKGINIYGSNFK